MNLSESNKSSAPPPDSSREGSGSPSVAEKATEAAHKAKSSVGDAASRARAKGEEIAGEKKEEVAERIEAHGAAAHKAAESFEDEDPNIAWVTHRAAERLEGIARYLRNHDFRDLRDDGERLARRHPAAFLGSMFVAGVLAGGLLKAGRAAVRDEDEAGEDDLGPAGRFASTGDLGAPPEVIGEENLSPGTAGFQGP